MSALVIGFFSACSVYQSADALPDFKEQDLHAKQVKSAKQHKGDKPKQRGDKEESHAQTSNNKDAKLEATLQQLSAAIAENTKKMNALDKQMEKTSQPPTQTTSTQLEANNEINWEAVDVKEIPDNKLVVVKSNHFLVGYGVSGIDVDVANDANAKESAYFNARRMLSSLIYRKLIWKLDQKRIKSEYLKSILLFTIDKAINSADIYKERTYIPLASYHKVLAIFVVDTRVLERIKQLVQMQYTFNTAQRQVIDQAILDMQNEDATY